MGASIGGQVGMYLLGQGDISCKTAVFEGVPLYENAWLIYKFMKFGFVKKHRKAVQMPLAEVKKAMTARYGVFGDVMAENFVKMSEKSLITVSYTHLTVAQGYETCDYWYVGDRNTEAQ